MTDKPMPWNCAILTDAIRESRDKPHRPTKADRADLADMLGQEESEKFIARGCKPDFRLVVRSV